MDKMPIPNFMVTNDAGPLFRAGNKPQKLMQIVGYIEENLWSPLELSLLAEQANLSKFHFCRAFKRHIGLNPMKFVASRRIERAKELLAGGSLPVSAVANEVGFRDPSNFIRQFKKITGVTPTVYRSDKARERASSLDPEGRRETGHDAGTPAEVV